MRVCCASDVAVLRFKLCDHERVSGDDQKNPVHSVSKSHQLFPKPDRGGVSESNNRSLSLFWTGKLKKEFLSTVAANVNWILLSASHCFYLTENAKWSFGRRLWNHSNVKINIQPDSGPGPSLSLQSNAENKNQMQTLASWDSFFVWGGCQCNKELTQSSQHTKSLLFNLCLQDEVGEKQSYKNTALIALQIQVLDLERPWRSQ